jgi:hypothetical protein
VTNPKEPKLIFSVLDDENGDQIDFWIMHDEKCESVQLGIKANGTMTRENVLDALEYFVGQVTEQGLDFLNITSDTRH